MEINHVQYEIIEVDGKTIHINCGAIVNPFDLTYEEVAIVKEYIREKRQDVVDHANNTYIELMKKPCC